jgi:hypothetical protein
VELHKGEAEGEDNKSSSSNLIKEIKLLGTTSITQDYCKRLSNSMPGRIQQMMAAKKRPPVLKICLKYVKICKI